MKAWGSGDASQGRQLDQSSREVMYQVTMLSMILLGALKCPSPQGLYNLNPELDKKYLMRLMSTLISMETSQWSYCKCLLCINPVRLRVVSTKEI